MKDFEVTWRLMGIISIEAENQQDAVEKVLAMMDSENREGIRDLLNSAAVSEVY